MSRIRAAVVGAGAFGRNHLRVLRELEQAELVAAVDTDPARAAEAACEFGCTGYSDFRELVGRVDAAVVAVPTVAHASVAIPLLEAGIDVLVEKPIAPDLDSARRMAAAAQDHGRILQVGHLERYNPAVEAVGRILTTPLFFEIHRMSVFSPRSLDVDVVLDLMIHDIDIVLSMTGMMPEEIRAAGLAVLSEKVDIASVRLAFANGCVANLTASRVSTEKVRKVRIFQPGQYISLDYQKREAAVFTVGEKDQFPPDALTAELGFGDRQIGFDLLRPGSQEPLRAELTDFLNCVSQRAAPRVQASDAVRALEVSLAVLDRIEEHLQLVSRTLSDRRTL
jgi:predicted dehydrogenase